MPDYQQHERFGVHYLRPTSAPVFVYPTESHLTMVETVAHLLLDLGFQEGGHYSYRICVDPNETLADQDITGMGGLNTAGVIDEVKKGAQVWETAIGDTTVLNTSFIKAIPRADCAPADGATDENQVVFPTLEDETRDLCNTPALRPTPPGCWKNRGGWDLAADQGSNETTIVIRGDQYRNGLPWDTQTLVGMCTQLLDTMAHEVGHALGLSHPARGADRSKYAMAGGERGPCDPLPYDIVAVMAQYQSR